ncbi:MAG TPA: polyhydroxyalkanoic acid system family protein [Polyangiaceae bacterium LLY-WYZ-14_1]|nr:polyhydroxyalkanoic acid system family protein [Polyangiaceae bacterium LLY-WYZ-14_1]
MPTIDVRRRHDLGLDQARAAADRIAARLEEKAQIKHRWEGDVLRLERSGANGRIDVGATEVRVQIDLSLMLRPMKGQVERKVHDYLDRYLVGPEPNG